ncbi:hypothetical protein BU17DRAFT_83388 [Hysterangium stoloniferum]|nr:hypothetical protein BU17DRAFT_83388 [Hysterangium stoloniferum]
MSPLAIPMNDLINDLSLDVEDDNDRMKTPPAWEVDAVAIWLTIGMEEMLGLVNNDVKETSGWAGWKAAFRIMVDNAEVQREAIVLAAKVSGFAGTASRDQIPFT